MRGNTPTRIFVGMKERNFVRKSEARKAKPFTTAIEYR